MSMYNLLFGKNPNSSVILALIGLKENDIERFRDCSISEGGIKIHTRTGGGNRSDYPNEKLTSNPNYLHDEDDDFDSTYADFYFSFPENLKEDCLKFLDVEKNGVPASIIKAVNEVMSRPETDSDKWTKIYTEQQKVYSDLRWHMGVYETNGHTIIPLSDEAMESLLKVAEKNDYPGREGEFLPYSVRPYKLVIEEEVPKWSFEKDKDMLCRVKVSLTKNWEVDQDIWKRYKEKFSSKYPKAIADIEKDILAKI